MSLGLQFDEVYIFVYFFYIEAALILTFEPKCV